jgi:hypothetical protein
MKFRNLHQNQLLLELSESKISTLDPVLNTLGTGYLNCLYAYKRKSASPVLNVLNYTGEHNFRHTKTNFSMLNSNVIRSAPSPTVFV